MYHTIFLKETSFFFIIFRGEPHDFNCYRSIYYSQLLKYTMSMFPPTLLDKWYEKLHSVDTKNQALIGTIGVAGVIVLTFSINKVNLS
jgi:hypothetical protein